MQEELLPRSFSSSGGEDEGGMVEKLFTALRFSLWHLKAARYFSLGVNEMHVC